MQCTSQRSIPPNTKFIIPCTENRISRPDLKIRLHQVSSKTTRRYIADVVGEVWIGGANFEGHGDPFHRRIRRFVIGRTLPFDARELLFQCRTTVGEPVAFFGGEIAAPMADFDIAFEESCVWDGASEFVADGDGCEGACSLLVERTVGYARAGTFRGVPVAGINRGEALDIVIGELELSLLL